MAWDRLEYERYSIRFRGKLFEGERQGLLVRLSDGQGRCGIGDIAPLEGWSSESLQEAEAALQAGRFDLPSVSFGIGSAERMLQEQALFASSELIPVSGLLDPRVDPPDPGPFTTVKVKVGRSSVEKEAAFLNQLLEHDPTLRIRLDANLLLSFEEACALLERVTSLEAIEYFEDPCPQLERWEELACPIALDEIGRLGSEWIPSNCKALILKPTLLGWQQSYRLATDAREKGLEPVISSSFESGIGHAFLALMASELQSDGVAAGLDPWMWIEAS